MPKAVILNDTSGRGHHGCDRVMRVLKDALTARGIDIAAASPVTHDWAQDQAFLAALRQADVVVINGEGTIHHGRATGKALLDIVDHPDRGDTPVALINALYQENPPAWGPQLAKFAVLTGRDAESTAQMTAHSGSDAVHVPDLSLTEGYEARSQRRAGLLVGDSVLAEARTALARLAIRLGAGYLPVNRLRAERVPWRIFGPPARWAVFNVYTHMLAWRQPKVLIFGDEADYLAALAGCSLHVTGRFHAVCMCLVTETPFVTMTSNSWKIEKLIEEAGVDPARLMTARALAEAPPERFHWPYSDQELASIRAFLADARAGSAAVFDRIAGLAGAAG